jgi:hypothetical protein
MRHTLRALPVLATAACGGAESEPTTPVTWHTDIRPIVEQRCATCHQPGGVGPTDFTDTSDWEGGPATWAAAASAAVASGAMPPWMPSDDCHAIEDDRGLTDAQRALFAAWAEQDHAVGEEADYVAPAPEVRPMVDRKAEWGAPDVVLSSPVPYDISTAQPDDYRCIVLDHEFPVDTWLRGVEVVPDQRAWVHHLILYQFSPDQVEALLAEDAQTPEIGYPCFNNPNAETMMAWAPGQNGEFLPEGVGRYVKAGSKWVAQIHYNTLGADPADVPADQTSVEIWEYDAQPERAVLTVPFANMGIRLPAGDPDVVERDDFTVSDIFGQLPFDLPLMGVMAHMHQLGTAISLEAKTPGEGSTCLVDIPRWDFNWQQSYYFPEDDWFSASSDTTFKMTCRYDNSAANQIVVNGESLEPRDVFWGENTTDEMCLTYLLAVVPSAVVVGF